MDLKQEDRRTEHLRYREIMADKFVEDQSTLGLMSVWWMVEEKRERKQKGRSGGKMIKTSVAKKLDFGKHKGATFGYVSETDPTFRVGSTTGKSYDERQGNFRNS